LANDFCSSTTSVVVKEVDPATWNTTFSNLFTSSAVNPAIALRSDNAFSNSIALFIEPTVMSLNAVKARFSTWYAP